MSPCSTMSVASPISPSSRSVGWRASLFLSAACRVRAGIFRSRGGRCAAAELFEPAWVARTKADYGPSSRPFAGPPFVARFYQWRDLAREFVVDRVFVAADAIGIRVGGIDGGQRLRQCLEVAGELQPAVPHTF